MSGTMKKILVVALGSVLSFLALHMPGPSRENRSGHPALFASEQTVEEKGFRNLTQRAYGVSMVNPKVFEKIWTVWEPEWKSKVDPQDPAQIRRLAFERYGFSEAPYPNGGLPMQYVATEKGWVPTCMQCHGGRLPGSGESVIGLPNTEIDLATLAEDLSKSFGLSSDQSRLGQTRGRTNAFVFSIELLRMRNEDLSKRSSPLDMGTYKSSDLDAIPWWHLKKKNRLYADGGLTGDFGRAIMQFTLAGPTGEQIRSWEPDFVDILAYLRSIEPPKYPWPINEQLAAEGKRVFDRTCSTCHGTYGPGSEYPNRVVPIDIIGTDPVRFTGVPPEFRRYYNRTWFGERARANGETQGYIAPPLDGIWASAPYFHNGSVPTIYGVLSPESRPRYFRRIGAPKGYDTAKLGLTIEVLNGPPPDGLAPEARRRIVDTTRLGLGNGGHTFGASLTESEKLQVIEYLKTL
jgi:RoxA-like, cytochrome c-like